MSDQNNKYVIATIKSWNLENFLKIKDLYPDCEFILIDTKEKLTKSFLDTINPRYVFFPHWSWIISEEIYNNFECVVFHSTDLPFGRGGSPIQNLIVRGIYNTKVSALKVCSGLDAGPIYFKEDVDISSGNVDVILKRISDIIFSKMIPRFINEKLTPVDQTGDVVLFERRKPEQSEIPDGLSPKQIYDYIRMLDGEGYPRAFIHYGNDKVFFSDAEIIDGEVYAKSHFII